MITGIFILTILFTDQPLDPVWNPLGPYEFSTYDDCRTAGDVVAISLRGHYHMKCARKDGGEVFAEWALSKIDDGAK